MSAITAMINLSVLFCINASDSTGEQMFLCMDSMMQRFKEDGKSPPKLVYGYINGKKTPCMGEYELRELMNKAAFDKQRSCEPDSQKLLEINGLKRREIPMSSRDAVYKGKKDLAGVDLQGCDLKGMDLRGADLRNANLQATDLRNAILTNANLSGANLGYAYCKDADLKGADLTNCIIKGTYLHHADLTGVKGLTLESIRYTATVYDATFDPDFSELVKENCPNRLVDPGWQWQAPHLMNFDTLSKSKSRAKKNKSGREN